MILEKLRLWKSRNFIAGKTYDGQHCGVQQSSGDWVSYLANGLRYVNNEIIFTDQNKAKGRQDSSDTFLV